jgi:signal peptidase I
MTRQEKIEVRQPRVGDIVLYKHKDRATVYPGIICDFGRNNNIHLVYFGNISGSTEYIKDVSHGIGNGQFQYKDEVDLEASYDKSFPNTRS